MLFIQIIGNTELADSSLTQRAKSERVVHLDMTLCFGDRRLNLAAFQLAPT